MRLRLGLLGGAALLALAVAFAFVFVFTGPVSAQMGQGMGPPLDQVSGDEFDKAFLREMIAHHAMAVAMARPVVANAARPEVKELGQAVIDAQTREIAQMRSWARDWYGIDIPDPMPGMPAPMPQGQGHGAGHAMHGAGAGMGQGAGTGTPMQGGMPGMPPGMPMHQGNGMAQHGDMSMVADLWKLPPHRLEAVFLSLMIPHHEGALDMAKLVPDRAAHQDLKDLSQDIIASQSAEIDQMNRWLTEWYGL